MYKSDLSCQEKGHCKRDLTLKMWEEQTVVLQMAPFSISAVIRFIIFNTCSAELRNETCLMSRCTLKCSVFKSCKSWRRLWWQLSRVSWLPLSSLHIQHTSQLLLHVKLGSVLLGLSALLMRALLKRQQDKAECGKLICRWQTDC